jgi:thiopeptide-type bacteriocin biosynthesis protein
MQSGDDAPYVPWADLQRQLEAWRLEGRFQQFFFMRKPPGLRLRFEGPDLVSTLEHVLVRWLEDAERRNLIRSFRFATYEPEVFLFGGQTGMALAHEHFDRDSRLILAYETLNPIDLPRDRLSVALMHDLFVAIADDQSELWDIWQRVWHGHGRPPLPPPAAMQVSPLRGLETLSSPAARLLDEGRSNNARVACRLHAADVARRLDCGPRAWLATACTFHWNRIGLSLDERVPLMAAMLHVLDPHRAD